MDTSEADANTGNVVLVETFGYFHDDKWCEPAAAFRLRTLTSCESLEAVIWMGRESNGPESVKFELEISGDRPIPFRIDTGEARTLTVCCIRDRDEEISLILRCSNLVQAKGPDSRRLSFILGSLRAK